MSCPSVIVVGGGPAGSAAAARVAEAGARVVLVERTSGPHDKVCGEFLSDSARRLLDTLGLATRASRHFVRLHHRGRAAEAPLPFAAAAVSRRHLDEELLATAAARGAEIRRGTAVRQVADDPPRVLLSSKELIEGDAVFLAAGKHDLHSHRRRGGIQTGLLGLKMRLAGDPAPEELELIDLLLFEGGYAGLHSLADGGVTLSLLVRPEVHARLGRSWPALLNQLTAGAPRWRWRLRRLRPAWLHPMAVYDQPYGFVASPTDDHIFHVGDQMAVVPSFTGEGMAMALASARLAVDHLVSGGPAAACAFHAEAAAAFAGVRPAAVAARALERPTLQAAAIRTVQTLPRLLTTVASATRFADRI